MVPLAARASACWRLGTWDGFMIPKPFATVTIAYGDPTPVVATSSREAGESTALLGQLMEDAQRRAAG